MDLQIDVIDEIDLLKNYTRKWEKILAGSRRCSISLIPQWFDIWW